jgi:acetate---CoA ligase (ADP-forming)
MIPRESIATLRSIVDPRSVAIVGASNDPRRIGGRPLSYMLRAGYGGSIWPVNPTRSEVQGLPAFGSILDVPEAPDACIIAVESAKVASTLEACAERGVRGAVVFSSGFAEIGPEGRVCQDRMLEVARRAGIRLLGPNCLGVFNARSNWIATFSSPVQFELPRPGPVSIASQSGAVGSHIFELVRARGVQTGIWITTGNEADVDLADCIAYLARDEETRVIVAYAEGIRDGSAMRAALEEAALACKPVIFMKVGRSAVGAEAAASHTAALAGSDRMYDALFAQYGVLRVHTTDQLVDAAYAASRAIFPSGNRLGILTISGGVGVLMADAAEDLGLEVPPLPEEGQAMLKALVPYAAVRNPVDITAQAFNDLSLITANLEVMIESGSYDVVVAFFTMLAATAEVAVDLGRAFGGIRRRFPNVPVILSLITPPEVARLYEEGGFLVYQDPSRAVAAARVLTRFGRSFERGEAEPPPPVPDQALRIPQGPMSEGEAMNVLSSWGVDFPRRRVARSADEAAAAARELGKEVVLKVSSPDILHKTEVRGVLLGIRGEAQAREGFHLLMQRVREHRPSARIDGVLVAERIADGVEMVVGVVKDPVFGPAVMIGIGGVFVELLEDVVFRLAPFGIDEARQMIGELRFARVLDGFRGAPAADVDALATLLARVSVLATAEAERLDSLDLNPVRVLPNGRGVVALDAAIVPTLQPQDA